MEIFSQESYKSIIRIVVDEYKRQFGQKFTYEKLAHACGIQKTYLSRILNGPTHFTADQCFQACDFLGLNEAETEFMILLHAIETTHVPKRRRILEQELKELRRKTLRSESVLSSQTDFSESFGWEYFGNANLQLVYLFLTVPRFRNQPKQIAQFIGLNELELQQILIKLQSLGILKTVGGKYHVEQFSRHLSKDSPYINLYRLTNRLKVVNRLQTPPNQDDYFFSAMFSADAETVAKIHRALLEVVAKTQKAVADAQETDVYQLNLDLIHWT